MIEKRSKQKKKKRWIVVCVIVLAAIAGMVFILLTNAFGTVIPTFAVDDKASTGNALTQGDMQTQLQKSVDESMFSFRINSAPEFENGSAEGNMVIENPPYNTYMVQVTITRDDTGEEIYKTDLLPIGTGIPTDSLDIVLPKGEYPATAVFSAYDKDTQTLIGQTAAGITITVKN